MLFNEKVLFLHVPKTGGVSVSTYLVEILPKPVYYFATTVDTTLIDPEVHQLTGLRHETLAEASSRLTEFGLKLEDFALILAVLRDPYALAVSQYSFMIESGYRDITARNPQEAAARKLQPHVDARPMEAAHVRARTAAIEDDFEAFMRYRGANEGNGRSIDKFFRLDGRTPPNLRVLRLEQIDEDLREALALVGIEKTSVVPQLNKSAHEDHLAYYTREAEEAVYQRYKWVFDEGYYPRLDRETFQFASEPPRKSLRDLTIIQLLHEAEVRDQKLALETRRVDALQAELQALGRAPSAVATSLPEMLDAMRADFQRQQLQIEALTAALERLKAQERAPAIRAGL